MNTEHPAEFKQAGPQDQLKCILMALEGNLSNLEDGIIEVPHYKDKVSPALEMLRTLSEYLPQKWNQPKNILDALGNTLNIGDKVAFTINDNSPQPIWGKLQSVKMTTGHIIEFTIEFGQTIATIEQKYQEYRLSEDDIANPIETINKSSYFRAKSNEIIATPELTNWLEQHMHNKSV